MQFLGIRMLFRRIGAIKDLLRDPTVKFWKKSLVFLGIAYLLLPFDLIPVVIFPFAIADDVILWIYIIWTLKDELDKYENIDKDSKVDKNLKKEKFVEGVNYEVYEEKEEGEK